jgi:hypothetical protein
MVTSTQKNTMRVCWRKTEITKKGGVSRSTGIPSFPFSFEKLFRFSNFCYWSLTLTNMQFVYYLSQYILYSFNKVKRISLSDWNKCYRQVKMRSFCLLMLLIWGVIFMELNF